MATRQSYLHVLDGEDEIRRFSVPQDAASSFAYLVEKIQRVYPQLLRQKFTVAWKDSDAEKVTFSSDEELTEALSNWKGDFFRVFIDGPIDQTKPQKKRHDNEPEHPGVICDGCDENIRGSRFKCVVCPDYDLCSSCDDQGIHTEHEMLRIRVPRTGPYHGQFRGGRGRGFGCGGPKNKGPRRHCGRTPFGYGFSFPPQNGTPFAGPFAWGCPRQTDETKSDAPGPSTANNQQQEQPDFNDVMKAVGDMMSSLFNGQQGKQSEENTGNKNAESTRPENTTTNTPPTPEHPEQAQSQPTNDANAQSPDFVMVDKSTEQKDQQLPQPEAEATAPQQPYRTLTNEEIFQLRLNEATLQLVQMGFTNEGGWLTTLLTEKNCDIGKVLDMLSVAGKQ